MSNHLNDKQRDWYTNNQISLAAQLDAADARMKIAGKRIDPNDDPELESIEDSSEFNMIMNNQIPESMTWLYWKWINQMTLYWIGKYSDFETTEHDKEMILATIWIAVMYGKAAYSKSLKKAFYITRLENGKYYGYPAEELFNDTTAFSYSGKSGYAFREDYAKGAKVIEIPDAVICTWRFGDIGNFVWYLQEGCLWLYMKTMVACNSSNLINKMGIKVNNMENFKKEYKRLLSPMKNIFLILNDSKLDTKQRLEEANQLINQNLNSAPNIEQLILASKFIQETTYQQYGIEITSAKQQSLSSDANLTVSQVNNIAKEHDRRIQAFLKQLGIELVIEEPDMTPQNQNADKNGAGTANTDGDALKEKEHD